MDMKIAELEWEIKQNNNRIVAQIKRVLDHTASLPQAIENGGNFVSGYDQRAWIDGHVSEEVTKLASLLQKQDALAMALNIVKKGE